MQPNISVLILFSLSLILTSCTSQKNIKAQGNPNPAPITLPEKPTDNDNQNPVDSGPVTTEPTPTPVTQKFSRILCETSSSSQFMTFASNASINTYPQLIKMYSGNTPLIETEITELGNPQILKNEQNVLDVVFSGQFENTTSLFQSKVNLAQSFGTSVKLADLFVPKNAHSTAQINLGLSIQFYDFQNLNQSTEIVFSDMKTKKYVYVDAKNQQTFIDLTANQAMSPRFIKNTDWIAFSVLNKDGAYEFALYSKSNKKIQKLAPALSSFNSQISLQKVGQKFYWLETDSKSVTLRSIDLNLKQETLKIQNLTTLAYDKINFEMTAVDFDQKQYLALNQETYKSGSNQKSKLESGRIVMIDISNSTFQSMSAIDYPASVYESANRFGLSQVMGKGLYFSKPQNKLFIRLRDLDGFMTYHSYDLAQLNWTAHHIFSCGNSSHFEEAQ